MNWKEGFGGLELQHLDIPVVLQPFQIIRTSNFVYFTSTRGTEYLAL